MKNTQLFPFSILLLALLLFSCQQKPTTCFIASTETANIGETITFTDCSLNAVTYLWDFDDGSVSVERNPSHVFTTAGTYLVSLTTFSKNGRKLDTATLTITIANPVPTAVRINSLLLTNWPSTDGGAGWDLTDGPDIYLKIYAGTALLLDGFALAENANPASDYSYTSDFPLTLTLPSVSHTIELWDYDVSSTDDYMAGMIFTPNDFYEGYPSTLTLSTSSMSVELNVTWFY